MTYLLSDKKLDLTAIENATTTDNWIHAVYLEVPPKSAVLMWLAKKGPKPRREARAIVLQGRSQPNQVIEIVVGPLPQPKQWRRVDISKSMPVVPYSQRPFSAPDALGWVLQGLVVAVISKTIASCSASSYTGPCV